MPRKCETCPTPRGCPEFIARVELEAFMAGWVARDANHLEDMPNALTAYLTRAGAVAAAGLKGAHVAYRHPSWGDVKGRIVTGEVHELAHEGGGPGPCLLVQDLSKNGAREWWPVDGLTVVGGRDAS